MAAAPHVTIPAPCDSMRASVADDILDVKTFDLDKWLGGSMRVTKFVEVYGKAGLQADIDELDARLADLDPDDDERDTLVDRLDALRDEMEASKLGLKFSSIPDEQVERIRKRHKGSGDDVEMARAMDLLAAQCVQPSGLTAAQFAAMRDALGDGYFAQTILTTAALAQQGLGVTAPFSSAASRARKR